MDNSPLYCYEDAIQDYSWQQTRTPHHKLPSYLNKTSIKLRPFHCFLGFKCQTSLKLGRTRLLLLRFIVRLTSHHPRITHFSKIVLRRFRLYAVLWPSSLHWAGLQPSGQRLIFESVLQQIVFESNAVLHQQLVAAQILLWSSIIAQNHLFSDFWTVPFDLLKHAKGVLETKPQIIQKRVSATMRNNVDAQQIRILKIRGQQCPLPTSAVLSLFLPHQKREIHQLATRQSHQTSAYNWTSSIER